MMTDERTVFVVDDDAELRDSIGALVMSLGFRYQGFSSAEAFLEDGASAKRGVVVVDLRMPGMNGLQLQEELLRRGSPMPVILLTGFARTQAVVQAIHNGAVTAIDKPYHDDDLWDAIHAALEKEETQWKAAQRHRELHDRIARLHPGERQVCEQIIAGKPNKAIAQELGLALRTVEKRRHDALAKLEVGSVAEMVALFFEAGKLQKGQAFPCPG